jgi:hypothetical protein
MITFFIMILLEKSSITNTNDLIALIASIKKVHAIEKKEKTIIQKKIVRKVLTIKNLVLFILSAN